MEKTERSVRSRRQLRSARSKLPLAATAGKKSPVRKEILHRVPTAPVDLSRKNAVKKLTFSEKEDSEIDVLRPLGRKAKPETAVERFGHKEPTHGGLRIEKAALFATVKGMLDERSRSGENTTDVSDASNSQYESVGSPAKRLSRQRPAVRPDESMLDMTRQSEMIDQLDMLHTVLSQGTPAKSKAIDSGALDLEQTSRMEQQRLIVKDIKEELQVQFESQQVMINRLQDDRARLIKQLEDMAKSLSSSAQENSQLREQIASQNEQKLSLQETIAGKTRQTEGLVAHVNDLRRQLREMSESSVSKQKAILQDISKLQQKHSELKGQMKRKNEELATAVEMKQDVERKLIDTCKVHSTEMQQVKAELTRQVNKLTRQVEQLVTERQSMQSGFDKVVSKNQRVADALQEADSRNIELAAANESLHEITDQYLQRINELTEAASRSAVQSKTLSESVQKLMLQKEQMITRMQLEERRHHEALQAASEEKEKWQLQLQQSYLDISDLKQQLQAVEQLVSHRTQQQMQSLTSQLVKKSMATEQLREQNESLRLQTKGHKSEIEELKEALHSSSLSVTRLEIDRDKTQTMVKQSTLELSRLREDNASLQFQVSQLNETLASVSQNAAVEVQLNDVQRKWSGSSELSTVSFRDLDTSIASNASQRLGERLDNLHRSYELQGESLSDKQRQLDKLSRSYSQAFRANETLKAALEERDNKLHMIQSRLDESLSAVKAEREREIKTLGSKYQKQLQEMEDEKTAILKDNHRLKGKLDETLQHLGEVGTALVRADQTVEELRAQCSQLNEHRLSSETRLTQQIKTLDQEKMDVCQQLDIERTSGRQKDSNLLEMERRVEVLQQQCKQMEETAGNLMGEKLSDSEAARLAGDQLIQQLKQQVAEMDAKQSADREQMRYLASEREQLQSIVVIGEEERRLLQEKVQSLEEANLKLVGETLNQSHQSDSEASSHYSFMELVQMPQEARRAMKVEKATDSLASGEVDELKSLLEVVNGEKQELREKIASLQNDVQRREEEMVVLRGRIEEMRDHEMKHQSAIREKEAVILEAKSDIARMTGKVKEMENKSPQADQLQKMKAKLEHFVHQKSLEVSELQRHYQTEIQSRELEYRQQSETMDMQKKQLEADLETLQQVARQEIQRAVQRLGHDKDEALRKLKNSHGREIEKLKGRHQQELHKAEMGGEVEVELLRTHHMEEIKRLQSEHEKDTENLTAECLQLRKAMSWLQQQWEDYSSTCIEKLTSNSQEVITRESTAVQSLVDRYDDVTTRLGELSAENAGARDVLVGKETRINALATDVAMLRERKERLQQQVNARHGEMLEMKLKNVGKRCEELEHEVSLLLQQVSALEEEKSHAVSALQMKIEDRDRLLQDTQATLESAIREKERLEQELTLSSTKNPVITATPSRDQLTNCLDQLKELRSQHHQLQAHYRKLIEQEQEREVELKSLRSTRDKLKQQTVELKSSQMKMSSENEAMKSSNEDMSREQVVLTTKVSHLTSMYEQLKSVNDKLKERNVQLQEERQRLLTSLSESGSTSVDKEEVERSRGCLHEAVRELEEKLESLRAEKLFLEEGVERLVEQTDGLLSRRQLLSRQIEELEKTSQTLMSDRSLDRPTCTTSTPQSNENKQVLEMPFELSAASPVSTDLADHATRHSLQLCVDGLTRENISLKEANSKLVADVDQLKQDTTLHCKDESQASRVGKVEKQLSRTKEKLKMKQRQANYLRLKLGSTLLELRQLKQGMK